MADLHAKGGWLQGSPLDRTEETKSAVLIVKNMMEKTGWLVMNKCVVKYLERWDKIRMRR